MKFVALVLALAFSARAVPVEDGAAAADVPSDVTYEAIIYDIIEKTRGIIINGHDEAGIPVLDPLMVFANSFDLQTSILSFDIVLAGSNMTGLSEFRVDKANFNPNTMTLDYDITLPHVAIRAAHYNMVGEFLKVLPLYGGGIARFDVVNLRMVGTLHLDRNSGGNVIVTNIGDAVFSVERFTSDTSGVIGGGDFDKIFNHLLNDLVHDYTTRFSRQISYVTTPVIKDVINWAIENLELV